MRNKHTALNYPARRAFSFDAHTAAALLSPLIGLAALFAIDGAGALLVCLCGVALFSFCVPTCSSRPSWYP